MTETKKRRPIEIYEDYWSLTVGHTDYFDKDATSFKILKYLSDRIDKNSNAIYRGDGQFYTLQDEILRISPKSPSSSKDDQIASTRKEINQFVKIGFIEPHHSGKSSLTDDFPLQKLREKNKEFFLKFY